MPGWNIADVLEMVARTVPASPAVIQGDRTLSWADFDAQTNRLATHLLEAGLVREDKVVLYLRNCPEYLTAFVAALKVSMAPVNTNFRYGPAELTYLWQDCEAAAVVFAGSFTAQAEQVRSSVPGVRTWLWVDDGAGDCPPWATAYEGVVAGGAAPPPSSRRDGDDLVLLYTGGTTGLPKGVMWRQDDLMMLLGNATGGRYPAEPDLAYAETRVAADGRRHMPAAPLMHGAGSLTCLPVMARGGAIVLLPSAASFSAVDLLDTVERDRVNSVGWVGDAFARPVLTALDDEPDRWNLRCWSTVASGGVLFSEEVKRGLLRHLPWLTIADVYGSTEAINAARSVSTAADPAPPPRSFAAGDTMTVIADDGTEVVPGSGQVGRVAYGGRQPLGYYRDPVKSAATFREINGRRFAITGDFATVGDDGRIVLLGRGSSCINTGGEKVYPEEVEDILKRHPSVADVAVLGLPDERFGERIAAAVELAPGHELEPVALQDHVRAHLAAYKVPRLIIAVPVIPRGPNGKQDIDAVRAAVAAHGASV